MKKIFVLFILLFFVCPIFACLPIGTVLAEQININSATLLQLEKITHVGEKTAQKIIDKQENIKNTMLSTKTENISPPLVILDINNISIK